MPEDFCEPAACLPGGQKYGVIILPRVTNNLPELALTFAALLPNGLNAVGAGERRTRPHAEQELSL